jgi:hypothetical protein
VIEVTQTGLAAVADALAVFLWDSLIPAPYLRLECLTVRTVMVVLVSLAWPAAKAARYYFVAVILEMVHSSDDTRIHPGNNTEN